jgi:hypothetical protein
VEKEAYPPNAKMSEDTKVEVLVKRKRLFCQKNKKGLNDRSEKKFQMKLWLIAVLVSLFMFVVTELLWNGVNDLLLLVYLIVGFLLNFLISILRNLRTKK